ncbi:MAG: putative membrane protein [Psychroserpens sp.]|jgi:uncharacterized membrane protein
MSLGCYIISEKKILINKESVKDKSRHVSPKNLLINEDSIFIYGDEDENQLIEKILSVEGVHRYGVFSLIFGTLNVYYKDRVKNTLNKLKKADINTYNEVKRLLYTDKKNTEICKSINKPLKNKFCVNCGSKIFLNKIFCVSCGNKIISSSSPSIQSNKKSIESKFGSNKIPKTKVNKYLIYSIIGICTFILICYLNFQNEMQKESIILKNDSNQTISVAIGDRNSRSWFKNRSIGWYNIDPNSSTEINFETIFGNSLSSDTLWLYAVSEDKMQEWSGNEELDEDSIFMIDNDAFDSNDLRKKSVTMDEIHEKDRTGLYKDERYFIRFKLERRHSEFTFFSSKP